MNLETVKPESAENLIASIKSAYANLGLENIDMLYPIYREDVTFVDPANILTGRDAMLAHFKSSYQNVISCEFQFNQDIEMIESGQAFLSWKMRCAHTKLNSRKPFEVEGVSYLRFDQQIYWHRDWFDLGAMVYEHIPLLGKLIRNIKASISA